MDDQIKYLEGEVYKKIIIVTSIVLLTLPFLTTFNELLTKIIENLQFVKFLQNMIAPYIAKIIVVLIDNFGLPVTVKGSYIFITKNLMPIRIYISWNCIGWQSFIIFLFTLITIMQGPYTKHSKIFTIILGLEGTFLVNIIRILIPILILFYVDYIPAVIFHDYIGMLLTLIWITFFWNYAFKYILTEKSVESNKIKKDSPKNYNYIDIYNDKKHKDILVRRR